MSKYITWALLWVVLPTMIGALFYLTNEAVHERDMYQAMTTERIDQMIEILEGQSFKLNLLWSLADDQYNTEVVPLCDVPASTAEEEYYRGVYDTCLQQMKRTDFCREAVQGTFKSDWFNGPSVEWTWPLPAPGTAPNLDPKGGTG